MNQRPPRKSRRHQYSTMMKHTFPSILRLRTITAARRLVGQCPIRPIYPSPPHRFIVVRGLSTTEAAEENAKNPGEVLYEQYLTAMQEWSQLQHDQEQSKSEKLFAAWEKSQEKEPTSDKAGGVAVVKTLVRETKAAASKMPPEQEQAQLLLQRAALEHQHPLALIQYANSLLSSFRSNASQSSDTAVVPAGTALDTMEDCLRYYRMAGDAGCAAGYYNLAHILWDGVDGLVPARRDEARQLFYQAIQLGDTDAMFFCGVLRLGQEAEESRPDQLQKGLQWMEQAAEQGHPGALQYLAIFYLNGYPPLQIEPCSEEEFQRRLTLAVEYDDSGDSYYLRGSCYYSGASGFPKDLTLSLEDFLAAAELGHGEACVNAGAMLHQGVDDLIPANPVRAFQLYQRGGELGCREGWRNVVACYALGKGVPQNLELAKYIAETMLKEEEDEEEESDDDDEADTKRVAKENP
jgi:TPR repeat protein